MIGWRFEPEKTKARWDKLAQYYKEEGLNASAFHCKSYEYCLQSQKEGYIKQYSGGTSALMPLYDVFYNDIPLRILIIGKETGYMANTKFGTSSDFAENTSNVLNCINWKKKNNHMKGTLLTLQYIFQLQTEYVYSSYALTNLLRCAFQKAGRHNALSAVHDTMAMRKNCYRHLLEEIKILEPTLVIAQGEWSTASNGLIRVLAEHYKCKISCVMKNKSGKYGLYQFPGFMCITSHHPAILGNWIKNLAVDSLWPMLDHLRVTGYLPVIPLEAQDEYEYIAKGFVNPMLEKIPSNDRLRGKNKLNS